MKIKSTTGVALTAAFLSAPVMAVEPAVGQGDLIIRAGVVHVNPSVDSGTPTHSALGNLEGTANGIDVDDNTQFGISGTYMIMDKVGIELLAATPFTHDIEVSGGALNGAKIGSTTHLPPTLTVQYYPFGGTETVIQPYAGAGVNYTWFFDSEADAEISQVVGGTTHGELDIDDSIGFAAQIGADVHMSESILVNISYTYADIDADATVKAGGEELKVKADLDPGIYRVNLGYKF